MFHDRENHQLSTSINWVNIAFTQTLFLQTKVWAVYLNNGLEFD